MPMGIVSDEEFEKELGNVVPSKKPSEKPVAEKLKDLGFEIPKEKGRGTGNIEVPNGLRQLIGMESVTDGRDGALSLAKDFGISASSTSAYTNGSTSTASYDKTPNKNQILNAKERVSKKARKKLMLALNKITDDKLEGTKARDLAGIAKDMSAIVRNMEPPPEKGEKGNEVTMNKPQFIFYSPKINNVEDYEVITVKE